MDKDQNKEVKEDFVKDESGNEIVNPELLNNEEKETPSDSSTEDKPDEEVKDEVVESTESVEESVEDTKEPEPSIVESTTPPKEVEGETPRERGLRLEVEKLRKANRQSKKESFFSDDEEPVKPVSEPEPQDDKLLSKYDKTELENFRELLQSEAGKMGFVKKGDFEKSSFKSQADDILDDFLVEHKEYSADNDPQNTLWDKFREEFGVYKKPSNSRKFKKLLDRVHKDVIGSQGGLNSAEVAAQQSKIKQASHGGTTIAKKTKPDSEVNSALRIDMLKGFSQEDIDELG